MIRKTARGYEVRSESTGRRLGGPYPSRAHAVERLRQVESFKRQGQRRRGR
jgi:hypothetical protein